MIFTYLLFAIVLLNAVRIILLEILIWQRKEYRLDRMKSFLHTQEGTEFLLNPFVIAKWMACAVIILFPDAENGILYLGWMGVVSADLIIGIKQLKRPKLTLRSSMILMLSLIVILFSFRILNIYFDFLAIVLVDRLLFLCVSFVILLTSIPSYTYIKYQVYKARNKILKNPNLICIGITGSFGKTTTKEFLASLLSQKYHVLKTMGTNNTEIGIAQTILDNLTPNTEIFIVEMGAYTRGEIRTLCNLVHPKIGIITGVNEEHIELFGSIENTLKTKYELVEGLVAAGIIFLNKRSDLLVKMDIWMGNDRKDLKKIWYGENYISDIRSETDSLAFKVCNEEKCVVCKTSFGGEHFIQNISGCVSVAIQLGLSLPEIQKGISSLKLPDNRMKLKRYKNIYIVDDTYNSNPDGVLAGLAYLSRFHGKKWLVFSPIIELSKEGHKIHKKIRDKSINVCDSIFLTNPNYIHELTGTQKDNVHLLTGKKQLNHNLPDKNEEIMIYFSGREAKKYMDVLLTDLKNE